MAKLKKNTPEQQEAIDLFVPHLKILRTAAGLTQQELADNIGVHRETYNYIEKRHRPLTWNVYLALMFFFTNHPKTKNWINTLGIQMPQI